MDFFKVLSVYEVLSILDTHAKSYMIGTQTVKSLDALGRTVSNDVYAEVDLPGFNRSTVDGYAVKSMDVMGASESIPSFLQCVKEIAMGEEVEYTLKNGETAYVPTGGMLPEGADGVVMIEYADKLDADTILMYKPIAPGENMTFRGDDLKKGEVIVNKGKFITPYDIGLLSGLGISEINVYKKPVFSVISTGDEIIDINETQKTGQVRDINGYALSALITQLGGEVYMKTIVKDDFSKLKDTLSNALESSDIIIFSGGSSVGAKDYTEQVIESFEGGQVLVHGVSIKPGKPTIIGKVNNKLVFGLPGHPVSAMIVFNRLVKEYAIMLLNKKANLFSVKAKLDSNVHSSPGKETYQMVQLVEADGEYTAVPIYAKSGIMTLLAKASGYIRIPNETEGLLKDENVDVFLMQEVNI